MRWLVLGATGALGGAVVRALEARGEIAIGSARTGAAETLDVADLDALSDLLRRVQPEAVINCAAIVDHAACEEDPGRAYAVNARPCSMLAAWSRATGRPLAHISTDQFFVEHDGDTAHDEYTPVTLIHEYARTKFVGEGFALTSPHALVVRTNMTAARGGRGKPSVVEWALEQLERRAPMTLFDDYYCSTIDAPALAEAVIDLVTDGATGLMNVAASQVFSKAEFIHALAAARGITLDWAEHGSAAHLTPPRAIHVGLDVSRATRVLGRALPDLDEVARRFVAQAQDGD